MLDYVSKIFYNSKATLYKQKKRLRLESKWKDFHQCYDGVDILRSVMTS